MRVLPNQRIVLLIIFKIWHTFNNKPNEKKNIKNIRVLWRYFIISIYNIWLIYDKAEHGTYISW